MQVTLIFFLLSLQLLHKLIKNSIVPYFAQMSLRQFLDLIRKKMMHFKLNDTSTFTNYVEKLERLDVFLSKQCPGLALDSVNHSARESIANSSSHLTMQQQNAELNELLQNGQIFINASKAVVDFLTANENYKVSWQ